MFSKSKFLMSTALSLCFFSVSLSAMESNGKDEIQEDFSSRSHSLPYPTQDKVNKAVASKTIEVYERINRNWAYAISDSDMQTQSRYWKVKDIPQDIFLGMNGEKQKKSVFTLVLPTYPQDLMVALEDLISQPAKLECTIALTTAQIFCMEQLLGREAFNNYSTGFYTLLQKSPKWSPDEFFYELPRQFLTTMGGSPIPSSFTYITNIPFYSDFKPDGIGTGHNVAYTDTDKYIGFSALFKRGAQPLKTVEDELFAEFVKKEDVRCQPEQHSKMADLLTNNPTAFAKLRQKAQEQMNIYSLLDVSEAQKFLETGMIYDKD